MLWVALHFPQFRRQALSRGHAPPEPEREALAAAAAWACRFTPRVSLEPPQALVMEVGGSLRHLGGMKAFREELRAGLAALGFEAETVFAPTARAALWRAAGGGGTLEELPVRVIGLEPEAARLLSSLGVGTVGGLMRLPRAGVALRFGQGLLGELDRARGKSPEARAFFAPPARFSARLELPAQVEQAGQLLFAAGRLLAQLEGFLAARRAGIRRFSLELLHRGLAATRLEVGLAAPAGGAAHFSRLLRERLARTALAAPVEAIRMEARDLEVLPGKSKALFGGPHFDPHERTEEWLRLVERLQARLGRGAVHGLGLREDHRPERAWVPVPPGEEIPPDGEQPEGARPLWLLDPPRPIREKAGEGAFALLAGPERIESGWWDGEDGKEGRRDYFIARLAAPAAGSSLVWVYRAREGWFLHGLFA